MLYKDFEFIIGSPFDKEKLICEIYYKDEIIAEISQETERLIIEIYPSKISKLWKIPFDQFQEALERARKHLLGLK